jgi:hypothetical protein
VSTLTKALILFNQLGIIGASTPFTTAQPVTLFYNDRTLSQGVIGFSLTPTSIGNLTLQHNSLDSLGGVMKITKCRGNIILELDESGATQLLLERLRDANTGASGADLYLGIYPPRVDEWDVSK